MLISLIYSSAPWKMTAQTKKRLFARLFLHIIATWTSNIIPNGNEMLSKYLTVFLCYLIPFEQMFHLIGQEFDMSWPWPSFDRPVATNSSNHITDWDYLFLYTKFPILPIINSKHNHSALLTTRSPNSTWSFCGGKLPKLSRRCSQRWKLAFPTGATIRHFWGMEKQYPDPKWRINRASV